MPETVESVIRHAAAAACLACVCSTAVYAQQPDQPVVSPAPAAPAFLSRADFQLSASKLAIDDIRFSWDTHFGGSLDVVDYVAGRTGIYVDYEAVLGDEYRAFDPNQGNYTLEAFGSARAGEATEIVGIFHHVSRHLSDRPKRYAIAWNLLGARVLHRVDLGRATLDVDVEAGRITQHSYVDYSWIGEVHVQVRRPVNDVAAVYGRVFGQLIGVNDEVPGRSRQRSGFAEVGVRLKGRAGVMELFAGVERRADADPVDRLPQQWALAGFRLLSR